MVAPPPAHAGRRMVNNTNTAPSEDPNCHCYPVPSSKLRHDGSLKSGAAMKCSSCYDYNKGVLEGRCSVCGARRTF